MRFPFEAFQAFCQTLVIDSKEQGLTPLRFMGSQKALLSALSRGFERDIHHFVILKGRQLGISTLMLALDLFWISAYAGSQAAMVADKEKTRDQFRATLDGYMKALPRAYRRPVKSHNRNQLVLGNRSRLAYLVSGGRQAGSLARGAGLNFIHATEISSWSNEEGVGSLMASMAETHPRRLYVFESTARGYNLFHDMWQDARRARSVEAVFLGWWLKEANALNPASSLFRVYDGPLQGEERRWARELKQLHGYELSREQWAWWRWQLSEKLHSRELMLAEYPLHEEQAFVLTGDQFFDLAALNKLKKSTTLFPVTRYSYRLGAKFEDMELIRDEQGELCVWEDPLPGASYVIAADPAYGNSRQADCFCVQVLRCEAQKLVQVAEYNTPQCTMYGFAWVLAHLCGAYGALNCPATLILELSGPGRGVLQELTRMPRQYASALAGSREARVMDNVFGCISHYLYRRPDSFSGHRLLQWETSWKTKTPMMHLCRDMLARGMMEIRSPEWVAEAWQVTRQGTSIEAAGTGKDDRVTAMAMGCVAWAEQVQPVLLEQEEAVPVRPADPVNGRLQNYLKRVLDESAQHAEDSRWLQ